MLLKFSKFSSKTTNLIESVDKNDYTPEQNARFEEQLESLKTKASNFAKPNSSEDVIKSDTDIGNKTLWRNLKAGAKEYFESTPEDKEKYYHEATRLYSYFMKTKNHEIMADEASNPKLAKSGKEIPAYRTKGLSLAPSRMSGINVCPASTTECEAACLGTVGRGRMSNVETARIAKTRFMAASPLHFYALLDREITNSKNTAKRNDQKLAVRLNVLSDIPHEHIAPELFRNHSDVSFYDYTKIAGRTGHKNLPKNYHLTLSSAGVNHEESNWNAVKNHLDNGGVASMVFKVSGKNSVLPTHVIDSKTGVKYQVVDGDVHDHRHLDHVYNEIPSGQGIIAGLRVKGGKPNLAKAGNFAVPVDHTTNTSVV